MGLLKSLFGPSQDEIWRILSREINGDFQDGGFWKGSKVEARYGDWTLTLDTYTQSNGKTSTTYTRLRAPYVNKDNFRFHIYRESIFSGLGRAFGMQDIEVGHPKFDQDYVIKGNNEQKLRDLFDSLEIRTLLARQPKISLEVKDDEGWFGRSFPQGVDELEFHTIGVIKDLDLLRDLFDLFAVVLNQLCAIGSAYEDNPHTSLK